METFLARLRKSSTLLKGFSPSTTFKFSQWPITGGEIFYLSDLSFAFVNLKPILPGHVLVCPQRVVLRFSDLTPQEVQDLWLSAQAVGVILEKLHHANSLTLSMQRTDTKVERVFYYSTAQDGPNAGQTVAHVHVHIIPRFPGDFKSNDEVYTHLDEHDANRKIEHTNAIPDAEKRTPRTKEEMRNEASEIRQFIESLLTNSNGQPL